MKMVSAIFLLAANLISNPDMKDRPQLSLQSSPKYYYLEPENIRESILDFTALLAK